MSSLEITLSEFVTKVPLCKTDEGWEKIVTHLCSSPSGIIAIVDSKSHPLGILESHKILAQIAYKNTNLATESECESFPPKLLNLISPLTSLSCKLQLKDFIALINNQESLIQYTNYFVTDSIGKVAGILDAAKVLRYIAKNYVTVETLATKKSLITDIEAHNQDLLFGLLGQIKLPVMLQDATGEICYQNSIWYQHKNQNVKRKQESNLFEFPTSSSSRKDVLGITLDVPRYHDFNECYGPVVPNQGLSFFTLDWQSSTISNRFSDAFNQTQNSIGNLNSQSENHNSFTKQFESELVWHYMQIPIQMPISNLEESLNKSLLKQYWLTIAIQLPLQNKLANSYSSQDKANSNEALDFTSKTNIDLNKLRRLQNEFVVNTSHELKTPLTSIIGLSSLLKEEKLGSLNARQIRYLDLIYRGSRQLMGIITDLLEITSLATGKIQLKWEHIELEKLCYQTYEHVVSKLQVIQDSCHNSRLSIPHLKLSLDSEASILIADRIRLSQILARLLENAIQSTTNDGEIGIRIEKWTEWIAIIVWDTGSGIAETFQNSLFTEVFEPDNFLISPEKTCGLGLVLAQQLAQSHGGDISFSSQINRGSEFTLLLPVQPCNLEDELSSDHSKQSQQSSLILIIEASSVRIQELTENLQQLGYHCAIARNHNEAMYKATHLSPIKIIINHELAELDSQNTLKQLQSHPKTANIPLLVTCKNRPSSEYLFFSAEYLSLLPNQKIDPAILAQHFPSLTNKISNPNYCSGERFTLLRLCPVESNNIVVVSELDFLFDDPAVNLCHHIIEADSIDQANILARIWKIDTIIWDGGNLDSPIEFVRSLAAYPHLAEIPLVTLDEITTAAANQFDNLTVFPCLISLNEQNIAELMQVIQSAATAVDNCLSSNEE